MIVNTVQSTIHDVLAPYKEWIRKNPLLLKDIESTMRCVSYLTAGRFNNSMLATELIYSIPNLLVLFNDVLMYNGKIIGTHRYESKIKIWITILEYTDVLLEMSAKNMWGEAGKWFIITIVQTLKTVLRLSLIHVYKARITRSLPLLPISREKSTEAKVGFILKRSGAVVRSVNTSLPLHVRTWAPPCSKVKEDVHCVGTTHSQKNLLLAERMLEDYKVDTIFLMSEAAAVLQGSSVLGNMGEMLFGPYNCRVMGGNIFHNTNFSAITNAFCKGDHTLYVIKPLLHLGCISITGEKQWHPWFLSFIVDWISLRMISEDTKAIVLNPQEREEIFSRKIALLLYLLRSPFYDQYTQAKIYALLKIVSTSVPLAKYIVEPLQKYLPYWQNIYFYTWSS